MKDSIIDLTSRPDLSTHSNPTEDLYKGSVSISRLDTGEVTWSKSIELRAVKKDDRIDFVSIEDIEPTEFKEMDWPMGGVFSITINFPPPLGTKTAVLMTVDPTSPKDSYTVTWPEALLSILDS